jgi:hypothetical protein
MKFHPSARSTLIPFFFSFKARLLLISKGRFFVLLTMGEWHCQQVGATSKAKLSLIQQVHPSLVHDHMTVVS